LTKPRRFDENAVQIEEIAKSIRNGEISISSANFTNGKTVFTPKNRSRNGSSRASRFGSNRRAKNKTETSLATAKFRARFRAGRSRFRHAPFYLSGESEYQLNGKTCRLRDIQDLFAGTGLSGAHYAMIEQGRIGQILSAKPSDRRNLIEEAAGISKFRTRQRAAETRLESAKTNLSRISDIVSEIDKQANALRRQAAKTRRYKLLREEFRVLLRNFSPPKVVICRSLLTSWKIN
jgi:chromosome segregation ATPase